MDLSVVIVNYNTQAYLARCLASIYDHPVELDLQVIVVDNHSSDGSAEMVRADYRAVQLLANEANLGFARANNQAFQCAAGRFVLLLNSDTEVQGEALAKMTEFLDMHPDAGAVTCRLLNSDGSLQPSAREFNSFASELFEHTYLERVFPRSRLFGRASLGWWDYQSVREVDWVTGACLMVPRAVLDTVGPLDESFFMYAEDADWCYRIRQAGWKIYYTPEAVVVHHGGGSGKAIRQEMEMEKYRSKYRLLRKERRYGLLVFSALLINFSAALQSWLWLTARILRLPLPARVTMRAKISRYCLEQHWALARAYASRWLARRQATDDRLRV